ncbi:MAG: hypothetical protein LBT26_09665 [Clostridiales Family XIII bacterium]|jgi:hypothetical protein|nr:hypothetical protein [Clostridiales Family XIII bacterium]
MRFLREKKFLVLFGINAVLYVIFIALDLIGLYAEKHSLPSPGLNAASNVLKYAGIVSCLVLAVLVARRPWQRQDARLQIVILCFTVGADFFLLFTSRFTIGICIFYGAHLVALRRYWPKLLFVGVAAAAAGLLMFLFSLGEPSGRFAAAPDVSPSLVIYICYVLLIICVTIAAFLSERPWANKTLSKVGMCLFLVCDFHVALFNTQPAGSSVSAVAFVLMWVFYLPAQSMLALSAHDFSVARQDAGNP